MISKNLVSNEEILEIISKKDKYFYDKKYESEKYRPLEIFENINLRIESDNFYALFQQKKIWNYFTIYEQKFIQYFLDKIKYIFYFNKIFLLFPKELFSTIYAKNAILVSEKYIELFESKKKDGYNAEGLRQDFFDIMEILTISNNSCTSFLKAIEKKINSRLVNALYLEIITQNNINLTE